MMPVVEAASREGHGVGAVLGGAGRAAFLSPSRMTSSRSRQAT
jgi:hypothetical protein